MRPIFSFVLFVFLFAGCFAPVQENEHHSDQTTIVEPHVDPCKEDRKKFCKNQPSRRGITRECLIQNAHSLSPDCKAYLIKKGRIR
ncbi:hypothetical protein AB3N59_10770 [Leptospira sp. WS92.C1]